MTSSKIGILGDLMILKPMFGKVFIHGDLWIIELSKFEETVLCASNFL
jgi:hypothetical protein